MHGIPEGEIEEEKENGDFIMRLRVPENEHFWYGDNSGAGKPDKRFWSRKAWKERICPGLQGGALRVLCRKAACVI